MNEISPETTQPGPRPFSQIPPLWLKLFKMGESFFRAEIGFTSVRNSILGIASLVGIEILFSVVQSVLIILLDSSNLPEISILLGVTTLLYGVCLSVFAVPIGFLINTGIIHLSSVVLGGKGSYSSFAYLVSIFFVPLAMLSSLIGYLNLIPEIGIYLFAVFVGALIIYQYVLTTKSLKAIHNFTTRRAILSVAIPIIILLVIPLSLIGILILLGPAIGSVFSGITESI